MLAPALVQGHRIDFAPLRHRLRAALQQARTITQLRRDKDASALWHEIYGPLSEVKAGLFGAVVSRAEAQVTRISCLYALLDGSSEIAVEHIKAALAVWQYAEASARFIFGDSLGDPIADEILRALRSNPAGLTRNEIRDLLGRNQRANRIDQALGQLAKQGLVRCKREETGGRPAERWIAVSGYAVYAVNAERGPGEGGYRVNRVYGVEHSATEPSSPEDTTGDDEVIV